MKSAPEPLDVVVDKRAVRRALLAWYDRARRDLPWRAKPGEPADPYGVWLSEIMLQQTTTTVVARYFDHFRSRWPTVEALAAAPREEVLAAWAGLGYYRRARNLHACAQAVAAAGGFPQDEAGLRALPGIGRYTAAAIAAIAFGRAANVVDGNVERVMARLFAVDTPMPAAKPTLAAHAAGFVEPARPGDWAQALMDLGATICTPRTPRCPMCPVAAHCAARAGGDPAGLPRKVSKAAKPERFGAAFLLRVGGAILTVRRPDEGLLGGMTALPSTAWRLEPLAPEEIAAAAPANAPWRSAGTVRHVFTHFALTLEVRAAALPRRPHAGQWRAIKGLAEAGFPSLFAKAAAQGLAVLA
jgi:A/G-specific adenine glycosylase